MGNALASLRFERSGFLPMGLVSQKTQRPFRARKALFSSSVSKHGEAYTLETSSMKGNFLHIRNV